MSNKTNTEIHGELGSKQFPKVEFPIHFSLLWGIILTLLLAIFVIYVLMPVFNYKFIGTYFGLMFILFPLFLTRLRKLIRWLYVAFGIMIVILMLLTLPIMRAKGYRSLIGKVESTAFTKLISPVNLDQIPVVDRSYAALLAEKKLGEDYALGSRVTLGYPTRQMVRNELLWVIPLLHSGFFKWLTNLDGTPAYIMVSATNPQDVRFIREVNGSSVRIKYQQNAFYQQNLRRHLYLNGYFMKGLTDFTFELNDEGEPFWTTTVYRKKVGFSGNDAQGIAIVNVQTGEINYYPVDKVPRWVDRIHPSGFVLQQLDWWGNFVHGYWNTKFGKRDMLKTTQGYNIIYGIDERCYYYTGVTSVGSDEGTVGIVLVDTRTKKTHLYRLSGATESAAMRSAEGKVQQYRYNATFPIFININGLPTYFITLKDNSGLVKIYSMVSVEDYSVVGVGETVKSTRDSYLMAISASRAGLLPNVTAEKELHTSTVTRIGADVRNNRTFYFITLDAFPNKIFIANTDLSSQLPLTQKGDVVKVGFIPTDDTDINLNEFMNLNIR